MLPAAPPGAWRSYAESDPIPGYFQFDWLSSRHPDLYHQFALSTVVLLEKLHTLIDLTGREVLVPRPHEIVGLIDILSLE